MFLALDGCTIEQRLSGRSVARVVAWLANEAGIGNIMPKLALTSKIIMKPLEWIASSKKDLIAMPAPVQDNFGFALFQAQIGEKHDDAKPLKPFKGSGVLEIVDDFDGDTYRAVYTVWFAEVVYVLHVFQKKSKRGIATPKQDIELIEQRLKTAQEHYQSNYDKQSQPVGAASPMGNR
jgi:phage-related protein